MPRPFRPLKSHTVDGNPIHYHPRIRPPMAPLGVPTYLRANVPQMFRLMRIVQALENHNRQVIETRLSCESKRKLSRMHANRHIVRWPAECAWPYLVTTPATATP